MQTEVVFLLLSFLFSIETLANKRIKRFLIYPPSAPTRHQFIAGIGIPAELEEESVTIGYVLKAEFHLPYNATIWRKSPVIPEFRQKRVPVMVLHSTRGNNYILRRINNSRWKIYKLLEVFFERLGYNGETCLLRTICDLGAIPFKKKQSLLSEILHILLTPSLSLRSVKDCDDNLYLHAENYGKSGEECNKKFTGCNILPLHIISTIF